MTNKGVRTFMFEGLQAILGDGGVALSGTGFEASSAQRDYSQHWAEAIVRASENNIKDPCSPSSIMLAGADTGTGKTVGYGVPLLLKAALNKSGGEPYKKVVIATHSHALQKQFLGTSDNPGDIVRIAQWIKSLGYAELSIARRLGQQAFISSSALEHVISQLKENRTQLGLKVVDFAALEPLQEFAALANIGKSSGLIEDVREQFGGLLPFQITASSICLSSDSDEEDRLAYDAHLEEAERADVVIVSHAYLASCALYRKGYLYEGGIDCLVIDEADRLTDVAASSFRFEVSLRRSSLSLSRIPGESAKQAHAAMENLANYTQSLHGKLDAITLNELPSGSKETVITLANQAKQCISKVIATAAKSNKIGRDDLDDLKRYEMVLDRFVSSSQRQEQSVDGKISKDLFAAAISFSPVRSLPALLIMPTHPGRIVARLWNLHDDPQPDNPAFKSAPTNCTLLTSATLGAPGHYPDAVARFKAIARDLGVSTTRKAFQNPEVDLWSYFEPEKFGAVKFILADPSVPSPTQGVDDEARAITNDAWRDYAVSIVVAAKAAGGRTLVLCNSYKDTQDLSETLLTRGVTVIEQVRGQSTKDCIDSFLGDKNAVWLSPTAWEGLNLPGAISNLVIPRMPFSGTSSVDRALLKAYGNLTDKSVENILAANMMNATKRKLRQGMFRPIRSRTDKARIWIADPRFPMHSLSQIPLRHPKEIKYSGARTYPGFHVVVPVRFQRALENAEVFKIDGNLLK
jgi:ATP-dependent DNA helicase DinG